MTIEKKTDDTSTDAGALFEASRAAHEPRMIAFERGSDGAAQVLLVPDRMGVWEVKKFLDQYRERPERAKGASTHTTLDSLVAHAVRNARPGSAAFLSVAPPAAVLTVVYDYHEALSDDASRAHWCEHGASYAFPLSEAWLAWKAASGKPMTQPEFAACLEARTEELARPDAAGPLAMALARALVDAEGADDVTDDKARAAIATPGRLRSMSRKIALRVEERAEESRDGAGNVTILYRSEITEAQASAGQAKGDVAESLPRPQMFLVNLPVFQGGASYVLPVRITTKVAGGKVQWTVNLHRADLAIEAAQNDVATSFATATGLPVFRGTPESTPK